MRPVRGITPKEENFRSVPMKDFPPNWRTFKRDPVEREPVGTIVLEPSRVVGYDPDCDGSLMARLLHVDFEGDEQEGAEVRTRTGIHPDTHLVVTREELEALFRVGVPAADTGLLPCFSCLAPADPPAQVDSGFVNLPPRWVVNCSSCAFQVEEETPEAAAAEWNFRLGVQLGADARPAEPPPPPKIPRRLLERFNEYLAKHPVWGALHAVLDDGNLEDHHIEDTLREAEAQGDYETAELAAILLVMDMPARLAVSRLEV